MLITGCLEASSGFVLHRFWWPRVKGHVLLSPVSTAKIYFWIPKTKTNDKVLIGTNLSASSHLNAVSWQSYYFAVRLPVIKTARCRNISQAETLTPSQHIRLSFTRLQETVHNPNTPPQAHYHKIKHQGCHFFPVRKFTIESLKWLHKRSDGAKYYQNILNENICFATKSNQNL